MAPSSRYGIAEWFGRDIAIMTPEERVKAAEISIKQDDHGISNDAPVCPFLSTLIPAARCNKASGVCTIRQYSATEDGKAIPLEGSKVVTICPSRFIQSLESKSIFSWISETMLDIEDPTIVKETPFLRKITGSAKKNSSSLIQEEISEEGKKAGRIDWILVNPNAMAASELEWCAVETQSLYFSGDKMREEFEAYAKAPDELLFPLGKRRPDYRSCGPKRLAPQLDVKVPSLRNWGKKVVVLIDRFFFDNMHTLENILPRAKNDRERRENSDITWFIVDFSEKMELISDRIIFSSLDDSRRALNATEPLSKLDFTENLKRVILDDSRKNKVFKKIPLLL